MNTNHIAEKDWQRTVVEAARLYGWRAFHSYDSRKSTGPGFPDLVLVQRARKRIIYVELKTEQGRLTEHQKEWRDDLRAAGQQWFLWRPSQWDEVQQVLGGE